MEWEARTLKIANPGFLEQIRAKRKRREAQYPVIAPLVIACLLSLREGKFSKEEKEEFGPLPARYATKDSCFFACNQKANSKCDFICIFELWTLFVHCSEKDALIYFILP